MRRSGNVFMSLGLIIVALGAVIMALKWSFKAALFPVAIGIPVVIMAIAQLLLSLSGKGETAQKHSSTNLDTSVNVDKVSVIRKDFLTFIWLFGFFLLIFLFGFTIAGPLTVLLYLKIQSKERWRTALIFAASSWVFFYGLFVWYLDTPFPEGLVVKTLKTLWVE